MLDVSVGVADHDLGLRLALCQISSEHSRYSVKDNWHRQVRIGRTDLPVRQLVQRISWNYGKLNGLVRRFPAQSGLW